MCIKFIVQSNFTSFLLMFYGFTLPITTPLSNNRSFPASMKNIGTFLILHLMTSYTIETYTKKYHTKHRLCVCTTNHIQTDPKPFEQKPRSFPWQPARVLLYFMYIQLHYTYTFTHTQHLFPSPIHKIYTHRTYIVQAQF